MFKSIQISSEIYLNISNNKKRELICFCPSAYFNQNTIGKHGFTTSDREENQVHVSQICWLTGPRIAHQEKSSSNLSNFINLFLVAFLKPCIFSLNTYLSDTEKDTLGLDWRISRCPFQHHLLCSSVIMPHSVVSGNSVHRCQIVEDVSGI